MALWTMKQEMFFVFHNLCAMIAASVYTTRSRFICHGAKRSTCCFGQTLYTFCESMVSFKSRPRYLYVGTISSVVSLYIKSCCVLAWESDFSLLTFSIHAFDQLCRVLSISWRPSDDYDISTTSSAYSGMLTMSSCSVRIPRRRLLLSGTRSLINIANRVGLIYLPVVHQLFG